MVQSIVNGPGFTQSHQQSYIARGYLCHVTSVTHSCVKQIAEEDLIEESLRKLKYSKGCYIFVLKDNLVKCA